MKNEYFPYFVGIFAGVNECSFPKFMSFVVGFGNSLAQGNEELWRSQNLCLSGADFWHFSGSTCQRIMAFPKFMSFWDCFFAFLWPKVPKNHGVPKICVFLGLFFGVSLAQSAEESWCSRNSCLSASRNA